MTPMGYPCHTLVPHGHMVVSHTYKVPPLEHHGHLQRCLMQSWALVTTALLMFNACEATKVLVA